MINYPMHCAPRCGAKTRSGDPCKSPAIHGKQRCRMHGGNSPGRPLLHGRYTKEAIKDRREWNDLVKEVKTLLAEIHSSIAI